MSTSRFHEDSLEKTGHNSEQPDPIVDAQPEEGGDFLIDNQPLRDDNGSEIFDNDGDCDWLFYREKKKSTIDKVAKLFYDCLKKSNPSLAKDDWNPTSDPNYQNELVQTMKELFPNSDNESIDPMEKKRRIAIAEYLVEGRIRILNGLPSYGEQLCLMDQSLIQKVFYPTGEQVIATIAPFINNLDKNKLTEIKRVMDQDTQSGAEELIVYLSEVLGIVLKPDIKIIDRDKNDKKGGVYNDISNQVIIYRYSTTMIDDLYGAIVHEMWHVHQHNIIYFGREDSAIRQLYLINKDLYTPPHVDPAGYIEQILEKEAYAFEAAVSCKIMPEELGEYYDRRKAIFKDYYNQNKIKSILKKIWTKLRRKDK